MFLSLPTLGTSESEVRRGPFSSSPDAGKGEGVTQSLTKKVPQQGHGSWLVGWNHGEFLGFLSFDPMVVIRMNSAEGG